MFLPGLALTVLAGCMQPKPPTPPETVSQAMEDALLDTGFYEHVAITRTIGRHHVPAEDAWTIVACYDFTMPEGRQGNACLDSFSAVRLDNGTWLVAVTVNGVYRWRAIGTPELSTPAPRRSGSPSPRSGPSGKG